MDYPHSDREDVASSTCSHDHASEIDLDDEVELEPSFKLTMLLHNKPIELPMYDDNATIQDLSDAVAEELHIPPTNQKFLITPKIGLLKPPFKDPSLVVKSLLDKKVVLMGATSAEIEELESDI